LFPVEIKHNPILDIMGELCNTIVKAVTELGRTGNNLHTVFKAEYPRSTYSRYTYCRGHSMLEI
jgi:hypothetical protein